MPKEHQMKIYNTQKIQGARSHFPSLPLSTPQCSIPLLTGSHRDKWARKEGAQRFPTYRSYTNKLTTSFYVALEQSAHYFAPSSSIFSACANGGSAYASSSTASGSGTAAASRSLAAASSLSRTSEGQKPSDSAYLGVPSGPTMPNHLCWDEHARIGVCGQHCTCLVWKQALTDQTPHNVLLVVGGLGRRAAVEVGVVEGLGGRRALAGPVAGPLEVIVVVRLPLPLRRRLPRKVGAPCAQGRRAWVGVWFGQVNTRACHRSRHVAHTRGASYRRWASRSR